MRLLWRARGPTQGGPPLFIAPGAVHSFDFAALMRYEAASAFPRYPALNRMVNPFQRPAQSRRQWLFRAWLPAVWLLVVATTQAGVWINEILFNPTGSDLPNEYVELRGTPNFILSNGTYLVSINGDTNSDPGTVQNVFDLSGRALGGNGFLVLLQNSNSYFASGNATVLVNNNGSGYGSGASSSVGHRGKSGQTDLENASITYLLIQSASQPTPGMDIDANNDGTPDGAEYAGWTVLDSVAVLDNDGLGDIGYGKINFRRSTAPGNAATVVSGTVVPVDFNATYVARSGNTTNWLAASWVAAGVLNGSAPNWTLDFTPASVVPSAYFGKPLNHIGAPNFGSNNLPGVIARESGGGTAVVENSGTDSYTLALNTLPSGNVTILITAAVGLQISTNGGVNYAASYTLVFNNTNARSITVRAPDDNVVDTSPHVRSVTHAITATADAVNYPTTALLPVVSVNVTENDTVLLSELKVNPPGPEDAPYEFVELRGPPNATLTNVYLLVIEGNAGLNPGRVTTALDLTGEQLGASGLLVIVGDGHPYNIPVGTRVFLADELGDAGGALGNGSVTFLLVSSPVAVVGGTDLDAGDNGTLEGLPPGTTIMDSVGWRASGGDEVYSPAVLTQSSGTPDAATRYASNNTPNSAVAWINANLLGTDPTSIAYDGQHGSTNFPTGTLLTPGAVNNTAPTISALAAFSSVIGDPTTPLISFTIADAETAAGLLTVSVTSSNQIVLPDANLVLAGTGGARTLVLQAVNVGYSTITVSVSDGVLTGWRTFGYAASRDLRGGGRFHTGVSDASAALAIDAGLMLVADDENQILRLFSRSNSGPAIAGFSMNPFLGLTDLYDDGIPKEVDLEGSTRVGNRLYWIGSHSHAYDAETRTNRGRIFTTDLTGTGTNSALTFVGRYDYLKVDLINWDVSNAHGKGANYYGLAQSGAPGTDPKATDGSGFNIEGLAMAPGSTNTAFISLRAPLVPPTNRVYALVVPVTNFAALAISSATNAGLSQFGAPLELNLGGRGIRSIEGSSSGYLIVAGPPAVASGTPPSDFRLFTWNGFGTNAPQERAASLANMIPEGIVELPPGPWTSNSAAQLISDNGITVFYDDAVEAKHLTVPPFKKFRSDWVTLGPVVTPRPVIRYAQRAGNNCVLTWYSVVGLSYRVQAKSALSEAMWTDVPGDVTAIEALATKSVSGIGSGMRFFRVIVL